ncbi:hypothetical protein GCM10009539_75060 [Cryptosporangium japonicum]|uniref:Uncharacterized protein n=1 Tax=Cryptosporangium japonicum TaxID=80872 RepID=A0ABN0V6I7_9ACTN
MYTAGIESRVPTVIAIASVIFALGTAAAVLWAVLHSGIRPPKGAAGVSGATLAVAGPLLTRRLRNGVIR